MKELHQQFIDAIPHRLLTNIRRSKKYINFFTALCTLLLAYEMPETGTLIGLLHEIKVTLNEINL